MKQALVDYYRCPEESVEFTVSENVSEESGFFRFGKDVLCYGQCATGSVHQDWSGNLHDALGHVSIDQRVVRLPFDPTRVIEGLRHERYVGAAKAPTSGVLKRLVRQAYYAVRPWMSVAVRRHLQKAYFKGWDRISFPRWPVDHTVESLMETLMALILRTTNAERIPFVWFWPDGAQGCAIMTHDVETKAGRDFCGTLMDLDDEYGIKTSFQIVPEKRYTVSANYLESIRSRGFEVNVQDLNHDGHLFRDHKEFLRRAGKINKYVKEFRAKGFRAAALYRNVDWYDAFEIDYDMSIPNVAHLDPQRGGCCTVMPYFIGKILELPVTTTQDYSLFQILSDYSVELWKQQIALILEKNGLISFIVHPDYITSEKALGTYRTLLGYLTQLRSKKKIWIALPNDVNRWWRERSQMQLVGHGDSWRIEGPGAERARLAYAQIDGQRIAYHVVPQAF